MLTIDKMAGAKNVMDNVFSTFKMILKISPKILLIVRLWKDLAGPMWHRLSQIIIPFTNQDN